MDITVKARRFALLVVATGAIAVLVAIPGVALAKTKVATRMVVAPEFVVDNSVAGVTPSVPLATVKLYRKKGRYAVAQSGIIRCYFMGPDDSSFSYLGIASGSVVTFPLLKRGTYKFTYRGSGTRKSCTAYTSRFDTIGETLSDPTISIEPTGDGTFSWVSVAYDVAWNTDAYSGEAAVGYVGGFSVDPSGDAIPRLRTVLLREFEEPETVEFTYRVRTANAVGSLMTLAALACDDAYIKSSDDATNSFVYSR
jgi:hypothetical protein